MIWWLARTLGVVLLLELTWLIAVPLVTWIAKQDLDDLDLMWKTRRETVFETRAMELDLESLREIQEELAGWKASRLAWGDVLKTVHEAYPPGVEIARATMRGTMDMPFERRAEGEAPGGVPYRNFYLQLECFASASGVVGRVSDFTTALEAAPILREQFEPFVLQGILKKPDRTEFSLRTTSKPRGMP